MTQAASTESPRAGAAAAHARAIAEIVALRRMLVSRRIRPFALLFVFTIFRGGAQLGKRFGAVHLRDQAPGVLRSDLSTGHTIAKPSGAGYTGH